MPRCRGDLGLQRRRQHLPGTVADDLIKQRPTGRLVGRLDVVDYLEHERTFPNQRANAGPDQSSVTTRSSSGRCASSRSPAEGHPQVLIIAPGRRQGAQVFGPGNCRAGSMAGARFADKLERAPGSGLASKIIPCISREASIGLFVPN